MADIIDFRVKNGLVVASTATILSSTQAVSSTTGALQVTGGVGIQKDLYVGGTIYGTLSGAGTANTSTLILTTARTSSTSHFLTFVDSNNTTATAESLYTTSSITVNPGTGSIGISGVSTSTSTTTGALTVAGGVGVGGSVYVGNRVGFVGTTSASAVYQFYNTVTNSLDTVFG